MTQRPSPNTITAARTPKPDHFLIPWIGLLLRDGFETICPVVSELQSIIAYSRTGVVKHRFATTRKYRVVRISALVTSESIDFCFSKQT